MNPTPNQNSQSGFVPGRGVPLYPGTRPLMTGFQPLQYINYPHYSYNSFLRASYQYPGMHGLPNTSNNSYMPVSVNAINHPTYSMYSHQISNNMTMVNQSKDPKQQQLQNPSNNTAQDQNKILSSNTSANSSKEFDRQKFKEELLCKNGREKEWHLRLLENDRKQVENMMEEAVELQIHFQNFQREFNQISQTSSTMSAEALQNFNLWNSWKENLLARRDQTFALQEERLAKFYQKVRLNVPIIVEQPIAATSTESVKPSHIELINHPPEQQDKESQPLATSPMPKIKEESLNLLSDNVKIPSDKQKSLIVPPTTLSKIDKTKIKNVIDAKFMSSVQSALNYQEKINRNSLFILENKEFTKSLNDFAFLRNQISFIDNLISLARSKPFENKAKHPDSKTTPVPITKSTVNTAVQPINISKNLMSKPNTLPNVPTSKPNQVSASTSSKPGPESTSTTSMLKQARQTNSETSPQKKINPKSAPKTPIKAPNSSKPDPIDQIQTIKIQITHPGQRKVTSDIKIDNKAIDHTVSSLSKNPAIEASKSTTATVASNSKDQPRTNNIQVPIVHNDSRNSRKNGDTRRNRNNNISLITKKPETIYQSSLIPSKTHLPPSTSYYMPESQPIFDPKNSLPSQASLQTSSSMLNTYARNDNPIPSLSAQDMNSFIKREQKSLEDFQTKPSHSYEDPNFFTVPRKYSEDPLSIKDLLDFPGRSYRPSKIVFIIRGLPGSGKTHLARLIKENEETNSQLTKIRLISMDNYYLSELDDHDRYRNDNGISRSPPMRTYDFDPSKEIQYKFMFFRDFREIITAGSYNFIILDSVNSTINDVRNFYTCAIEKNYIPYVIEMEAIVRRLLDYCTDCEEIIAYCYKHNQHGRSLAEIRSLYNEWQILPEQYLRVNAFPLMEKSPKVIKSPPSTRIIINENDLTTISVRIILYNFMHNHKIKYINSYV